MMKARASAAFSLLAIVANAHAQEVVNGSFEEPLQKPASYTLFAHGSEFKGWRVIGTEGDVAVTSGDARSGAFSFPAQDGNQWLDLTGQANRAVGVEQTVNTVPGAVYDLTFFLGNVYGAGWGQSSSVEVFVDGKSIGSATNTNGERLNRLIWQKVAMSFKANGNSSTIGFVNRDIAADSTNGLDSVSLAVSHSTCIPRNTDKVKVAKKKSNPFAGLAVLSGRVVTATDILGQTTSVERQVDSAANRAASASNDQRSAAGGGPSSDCVPVN